MINVLTMNSNIYCSRNSPTQFFNKTVRYVKFLATMFVKALLFIVLKSVHHYGWALLRRDAKYNQMPSTADSQSLLGGCEYLVPLQGCWA